VRYLIVSRSRSSNNSTRRGKLSGFYVLAATCLAICLSDSTLAAEPWHPAPRPLMTPWSDQVAPTNALPEYPRPQLVRKDWLNLNGLWDYAIQGKAADRTPATWDGKILVPYCIESALSGVMKPLLPEQRLWYRREFTLPENWKNQRVLLHFGAVDWETTVSVNGTRLGTHRGGYDSFTFDITKALKQSGPQEIVVAVSDPTDTSWQLRGKQTLHPGGAHYTACSGIWQTVWLEPVPQASVESLHLVPDVSGQALKLTVNARTPVEVTEVSVTVSLAGKTVATTSGKLGSELTSGVRDNLAWYKARLIWVTTDLTVSLKDAKLWTPQSPTLYDVVVELKGTDGAVLDTVQSYVGMREITRGKDDRGVPRPLLNGKPIMLPGALDQGYWPDGVYTASTDAALRFDIEAAKKLGLVAIRKHLKVEPERYYYWADRLGLLILQDLPSGSDGDPFTDLPTSPEASTTCEMERGLLIQGRWNHPSIIAWVMFNEGWGQHDTLRHAQWAKQLDATRLIDEASGFPRHGGGDIHDTHGGDAPQDGRRICLDSETAGFGLKAEGHSWPGKLWATGTYDPKTKGEGAAQQLYPVEEQSRAWYTQRMAAFYREMWKKRETTGTSGDFKVQLYDVETESNGLLSYDRAVWKVDPAVVAAACNNQPPPVGDHAQMSPATFVWQNPLPFEYVEAQTKARQEIRDPCIIREGDTYYLVFTMYPFRNREEKFLAEPNQGGSPGIALYSSRDLQAWRFEKWLVKSSELSEDCPYKNRFWAPEIHKIGGKFYLIFTADNWIKNEYNPAGRWGTAGYAFVGVADRITGPYEHITWIKGGACDTSLFVDSDGRTYAVIPRGNVDFQEIDLSGLTHGKVELIGQPKRVVERDNQDIGIKTSPEYLEGPWLEKIHGKYCLFYAELYKDKAVPEFFGYRTGVASADSVAGPYRKDPRGKIFNGGHLSVFDGPDGRKWFCYRGESGGPAQGKLCIDPIDIDPQGQIQAVEHQGRITLGAQPRPATRVHSQIRLSRRVWRPFWKNTTRSSPSVP